MIPSIYYQGFNQDTGYRSVSLPLKSAVISMWFDTNKQHKSLSLHSWNLWLFELSPRHWHGGKNNNNRKWGQQSFIKVCLCISGTGILCGIMWSSFGKQMENDCRLKQLMNTYTERSGATHVCSGQLPSGFKERDTPEGLHGSSIFLWCINVCLICQLNVLIQPLVLWQKYFTSMWGFLI